LGFFKFLKRENKKEDFNELDLPPLPPMESGHPSDDFDKLPELPELPDWEKDLNSQGDNFPKFDFPEMKDDSSMQDHDQMPNFPEFPKMDDEEPQPLPDFPQISSQASSMQQEPMQMESAEETEQKHAEPYAELPARGKDEAQPASYPKPGGRLFTREKLWEKPSGKTIYVKVDNFKAMLGTISIVRNDLKKSDGSLTKLENIKASKDKSFDKVKSSLDDMQKKLIFIDKTLFKGE